MERRLGERIALYAGSFDLPTVGHIDIVTRALKLFGNVTIGIGTNPDKKSFATVEQRVAWMTKATSCLLNVNIVAYDGLTADFAQSIHADALIRGLRPNGDFDNEFLLAEGNRGLHPRLETVWIAASHEYSYVSSSMVKQVALMSKDSSDDRWKKWVPQLIWDDVQEVIESTRKAR